MLSFDERGELMAPDGTVVIKNFELPFTGLALGTYSSAETRMMVQHRGKWTFAAYRWDSDGQDATLLDQGQRATFEIHDEKGTRNLDYDFPSPFTCTTCHGTSGTQLLGLSVAQLQPDYQSGGQFEAQLPALQRVGYIKKIPPVDHSLVDPNDEHAPLDARARSYLHANCSHCHRPGGGSASDGYGPADFYAARRYKDVRCGTGLSRDLDGRRVSY